MNTKVYWNLRIMFEQFHWPDPKATPGRGPNMNSANMSISNDMNKSLGNKKRKL